MKRIGALFLLTVAAANAEPITALSCTCDPHSEGDLCPGFLVRFNDEKSAEIARPAAEPKWSGPLSLTVGRKTLSIDGRWSDPRAGCLYIDRASGRFHAEIIEYGYQEFNGWSTTGVCQPLPRAQTDAANKGRSTDKSRKADSAKNTVTAAILPIRIKQGE